MSITNYDTHLTRNIRYLSLTFKPIYNYILQAVSYPVRIAFEISDAFCAASPTE